MDILSRFALTAVFILAGSVATIPFVTASVYAEDSTNSSEVENETETENETNDSGADSPRDQVEAKKKAAQANAQAKKEEAQARVAAAKLKMCQNREKTVNAIMARIADRGQKQLNLFTKISERTQAFYTEKGKTLENYDALVADVNAKKDAAQTTVDELKANSVTFKCDGTDPKGAGEVFKESLKKEIEALKAYKTSVKNLIVGVKSVQSTTTDTSEES